MSVVVLAPLLLFLPQRPRKGLVELWGRRRVHDCSGYVCEAGACFSSGQGASNDLYLADEVQASAQCGPEAWASTQAPAPLNGGCWQSAAARQRIIARAQSKFSSTLAAYQPQQ